jgi:large subunit ribosomal protein L27
MGKDFTLHALVDGQVIYKKGKNDRTFVSISPANGPVAAPSEITKKAAPAPKVAPVVATVATQEEE